MGLTFNMVAYGGSSPSSSKLIIVYTLSGATVTAEHRYYGTYTGVETSTGVYEIEVPANGTYTVTATKNGNTATDTIEVSDATISLPIADPVLDNNDWANISAISAAGTAANVWSVGDRKAIALSGTCGTLSLNSTYYVYIIGFDHNAATEGYGITFGSFKTAATGGKDIALIDQYYYTAKSDGTKAFNLNHWGTTASPYNTNYGGWIGSDGRYDILGSTKAAPSGYGSTPLTSRVGYDATPTTATNPVSNTLMSCLPSELRNVMKPITKYTDNKGGAGTASANVTASVDYLPLMAEYEVYGARTSANPYEKDYQAQYAYFAAGNSKLKYRASATTSAAAWFLRSPVSNSASQFIIHREDNTEGAGHSRGSFGLSPVFLV